MMNRAISSAAFAAMGLLIAYPASAACSLKTQPIPVKVVGFKPMITAKVNGKTGAFLLELRLGHQPDERQVRPGAEAAGEQGLRQRSDRGQGAQVRVRRFDAERRALRRIRQADRR
ncbi:MAG: hypothetical protein WDN45_04660 [Caulobacteraceae bacterium]